MKNLALISDGGVVSSLKASQLLAKFSNGKVASLADLITLRSNTKTTASVWNTWFYTTTLLCYGYYQQKKVFVVSQHLGPLRNEKKLIRWQKSGDRDTVGGRYKYGSPGLPKISQKEFNKLVEGKYGAVTVIDFYEYYREYSKHLNGDRMLRMAARRDPLWSALLGPSAEKFIDVHVKASEEYARTEKKDRGAEKLIFKLDLRDHYGWNPLCDEGLKDFPTDNAVALLMSLGSIQGAWNRDYSLMTEIGVNLNLQGSLSKFAVLRDATMDIETVDYDPVKHWKQYLIENKPSGLDGFYVLTSRAKQLFSEYPKVGNRMDTGEIMHPVVGYEKIKGPNHFVTTDCHFFLKYDIEEVKAIAPEGANAYEIIGDVRPGDRVKVPVQFYKVTLDTTKRVLRRKEVMKNLPLLFFTHSII